MQSKKRTWTLSRFDTRGRELRVQQRPLRERHVEDVADPVVEQHRRIEGHDQVDPEEQPAQPVVDAEVDRARRLRVGARPVDVADVAGPPHGQHDLERAVAHPVVVDPVGERDGLLGDVPAHERAERDARAVDERGARRLVLVGAEAVAQLDHARLRRAAPGDEREEIALVHVRRPGVVEDDVERRAVQDAALDDLDRRDPQALLPDRRRVVDLAAGDLAAHVHHVPEHRREADVPLADEDRQDDAPVVEMRDRALAQVGIVEEDHVALADVAAEPLDDARDVGAELADHHPAVAVADHRELVVLLADHRRHRGAADDLVHLEADVQQRVLDEVQGGAVDAHAALLGLISRLACSSTVATWPSRTTVVASYCSTTAGPSTTMPGASRARS